MRTEYPFLPSPFSKGGVRGIIAFQNNLACPLFRKEGDRRSVFLARCRAFSVYPARSLSSSRFRRPAYPASPLRRPLCFSARHSPNLGFATPGKPRLVKQNNKKRISFCIVLNPDTVTCGARLREEEAKRAGEAWERSDLRGAFRGWGGGKQAEHVTESGGSRVTWHFDEVNQVRQHTSN
ncbi:hypothetical protein BAC1_00340 [uncultured bacterium]|nr:hypothetical protein BAC1_00340 [uncultured bacterium]